MEDLYQSYKDHAEFLIVYIKEAHPLDGRRPTRYAEELEIRDHKNYGERCTVASRLMKDEKLTIPCIVDGMDNKVSNAYAAHPDRVFLVDKDGRLAIAGARGPRGFAPAIDDVAEWLEDKYGKGKKSRAARDADDSERPRRFGRGPGDRDRDRPPEGRRGRGRGFRSPLIAALDTDGDGEISASEIKKAPQSLKSLDKNNDGKLTRDEMRPSRPGGRRFDRRNDREPPPL